MRYVILLLSVLCVSTLAAQPVTVGAQIADPVYTITLGSGGAPVSFINIADYAPVAGTVNKASVSWFGTCSGAFKIVFLRATFGGTAVFSVSAVRGPFDAVSGRNDVTLTPPVTLAVGDVIGVVQLRTAATCGSVSAQYHGNSNVGYNVITTSDV